MNNDNELKSLVYEWPIKYKLGFMKSELEDIKRALRQLNLDKFEDALFGIAVGIRDGNMLYYKHDVLRALRAGRDNRGLYIDESD